MPLPGALVAQGFPEAKLCWNPRGQEKAGPAAVSSATDAAVNCINELQRFLWSWEESQAF